MENTNVKSGRWFGNFKKLILVLGIVIVLNLFFNYGVKTFYDEPQYENFCTEEIRSQKYDTEETCEANDGLWNESFGSPTRVETIEKEGIPSEVKRIETEEKGWCDVTHTCAEEFKTVNDTYKRNVFIILVFAGIVSIIIGFFINASEAVALGFSFGGILSLIIGTLRYWSAMQDYLRFIVLGVALIALVWLGIKKISD
jgi:hypothetical protein